MSFEDQNAPAPTISTVSSTADTVTVTLSEYDSSYGDLQYACIKTGSTLKQEDWITSNELSYMFNDRLSGTSYTCYVRYTGNDSYFTSPFASRVCYTASAKPEASVVTINYKDETISFSSVYEVNTDSNFSGTGIGDGGSITNCISNDTDQKLYVRVKEVTGGAAASEAVEITIPIRPSAPNVTVDITASTITVQEDAAWEYSTDEEHWTAWSSDTYKYKELGQMQEKTCYVRVKATDSSFASAIHTVMGKTNAATYGVIIPKDIKAGGAVKNIKIDQAKAFDLGFNGHVDVKVDTANSNSFQNGLLTLKYKDTQSGVPDITTQMLVGGERFTDLNQNIASLRTKDDSVEIKFETPTQTNIRAGEYSGTVKFIIEYNEGQ